MNNDVAKTSYETASNHFASRFQMRDNILLVFLAAVGAILGVAFGTASQKEILLVIPYLSLGCTFLIVHHNIMLGSLLDFCSKEITPFLNDSNAEDSNTPQFENSKSLQKYFDLALRLRTLSQFVILFVPSVFALLINHTLILNFPQYYSLAWWFAFICTISMVSTIFIIHRNQTKQIDHLKE